MDSRAGARLRLLHVAEPDEDPARAEELLRAFLRDARVPADVEVVPAAAAAGPAFATIRRESAGAGLVLIGLRPPAAEESDADYGAYLLACRQGLSPLPCVVFGLAAEGLDFRDVFE